MEVTQNKENAGPNLHTPHILAPKAPILSILSENPPVSSRIRDLPGYIADLKLSLTSAHESLRVANAALRVSMDREEYTQSVIARLRKRKPVKRAISRVRSTSKKRVRFEETKGDVACKRPRTDSRDSIDPTDLVSALVQPLRENIKAKNVRIQELTRAVASHKVTIPQSSIDTCHDLHHDIDTIKSQWQSLQATVQVGTAQTAMKIGDLIRRWGRDRDHKLSEMQTRLSAVETTRRQLHNTVQELKGNIRVICRLRPNTHEGEAVHPIDDMRVVIPGDRKTRKLVFDTALPHGADQAMVYSEIQQLIQSAKDGYNICIMAYGSTGSGKTHTMLGSGRDIGIVPRAIHDLMDLQLPMSLSVCEIYNNDLRDLLISPSSRPPRHDLRHGKHGVEIAPPLHATPIVQERDAYLALKKSLTHRREGATQLNTHSSRSHCIITITLQRDTPTQLSFVDLGGSECVGLSGAVDERLSEAKHINRSLAALGDVLQALGKEGARHIPYRNSKLTTLLQNVLDGHAKTLLFVTATESPDWSTLHSLEFGSRVRSIVRGAPPPKH